MSYQQTSLTTNLDDPGATGGSASASGDRAGALAFAGLLLIMVGVFHALQGLVALLSNEFYVVGENYWLQLDFTTWGWVHLVLGTLTAGAGVGLATVYRTLQAMVEAGTVDMLRTDDGEAVYRACSTDHHHHLVCRSCGRTVEVEGPAVERWTDRVAAEHGFSDVTHSLEIFGTCAECSRT